MHQIHAERAPQYLAHSVQSVAESSRRPGLRSANTADYFKRRTRTKFGECCFSHAGPAAWNSLPDNIKLTTDTNRVKNLLNTHLFHLMYWHLLAPLDNLWVALYKFYLYLYFTGRMHGHPTIRLRAIAPHLLLVLLSASLYVSKRGAYWDRLCRDVVRWSLVGWLVVGCHACALWPNGAS